MHADALNDLNTILLFHPPPPPLPPNQYFGDEFFPALGTLSIWFYHNIHVTF